MHSGKQLSAYSYEIDDFVHPKVDCEMNRTVG